MHYMFVNMYIHILYVYIYKHVNIYVCMYIYPGLQEPVKSSNLSGNIVF